MNGARFPSKRDDGTFSVSARFSISEPQLRELVEAIVSSWVRKRVSEEDVVIGNDLLSEPRVVGIDAQRLDVVFEGGPQSRRWKDWMVAVVQELTSSIQGVSFEGFYDLVANAPHPASLRSKAGRSC